MIQVEYRIRKADPPAFLQAETLSFHIGPDKPVVHHFLALPLPPRGAGLRSDGSP